MAERDSHPDMLYLPTEEAKADKLKAEVCVQIVPDPNGVWYSGLSDGSVVYINLIGLGPDT